jgi:hypothetical protein
MYNRRRPEARRSKIPTRPLVSPERVESSGLSTGPCRAVAVRGDRFSSRRGNRRTTTDICHSRSWACSRIKSFRIKAKSQVWPKLLLSGSTPTIHQRSRSPRNSSSTSLEYHQDGVAFWQKHGVHHPFLLPSYPLKKNTGGVPYHRKFRSMGLTSDYAHHVSFIEHLPIPTTGQTDKKRFWELFDVEHARRIDRLVTAGEPRMVIYGAPHFSSTTYTKQRFVELGDVLREYCNEN